MVVGFNDMKVEIINKLFEVKFFEPIAMQWNLFIYCCKVKNVKRKKGHWAPPPPQIVVCIDKYFTIKSGMRTTDIGTQSS